MSESDFCTTITSILVKWCEMTIKIMFYASDLNYVHLLNLPKVDRKSEILSQRMRRCQIFIVIVTI